MKSNIQLKYRNYVVFSHFHGCAVNNIGLCKRIDESGLKKYYIASKVGLTTYGLQKKINNQTQFKANEIEELCIMLKIKTLEEKEKIFFAKNVGKMETKKLQKKE